MQAERRAETRLFVIVLVKVEAVGVFIPACEERAVSGAQLRHKASERIPASPIPEIPPPVILRPELSPPMESLLQRVLR